MSSQMYKPIFTMQAEGGAALDLAYCLNMCSLKPESEVIEELPDAVTNHKAESLGSGSVTAEMKFNDKLSAAHKSSIQADQHARKLFTIVFRPKGQQPAAPGNREWTITMYLKTPPPDYAELDTAYTWEIPATKCVTATADDGANPLTWGE